LGHSFVNGDVNCDFLATITWSISSNHGWFDGFWGVSQLNIWELIFNLWAVLTGTFGQPSVNGDFDCYSGSKHMGYKTYQFVLIE
jgi:hypothetical protein